MKKRIEREKKVRKARADSYRVFCTGVVLAGVLFLGGCGMGNGAGNKTVQGNSALEERDYQQAQQFFQEAVQEGEQKVVAYRGLGMAYMGLAKYEEAEASFRTALEYTDNQMTENVQDIRLYLATVQYRAEKYEDTITTCDDILREESKGNADAYFLRGDHYVTLVIQTPEHLSQEAKEALRKFDELSGNTLNSVSGEKETKTKTVKKKKGFMDKMKEAFDD